MLLNRLSIILSFLFGLVGLNLVQETDACLPAIIPAVMALGGAFAGGRIIGGRSQKERPAFRLIGCYADGPNVRDMGPKMADSSNMNVMTCTDVCKKEKVDFLGLQNGTECYCSTKYGKYGETSNSKCNRPCPGNSAESCGGYYTNSVYRI